MFPRFRLATIVGGTIVLAGCGSSATGPSSQGPTVTWRRFLFLIAFLAACSSPTAPGGGGGSATPTSIAVRSGGGQTGTPGMALPAPVVVVVSDASGNPVANVAVTFAVDSGGGSLSQTTATTGSDGSATSGTWMLGPSAGRNTLRITAGSLAPIEVAATAADGVVSLGTANFGAGSGSFQVIDPGPLKGFSMSIPAGAVSAPLALTISYGPSAGVTVLDGLTPISPVITLANPSVSYLQAPMTIHIPAVVPAGTTPFVVMFNSATGAREVLPLLSWDTTGVTALVSSLSSDNLTLQATGGSLNQGIESNFTVVVLPNSVLAANYDAGFRPATDGWEFGGPETVVSTNALWLGMLGTSAWYFAAHASPTRLFGRFQLAPDAVRSDRTGFRWSSVIANQMNDYYLNATARLDKIFSGAQVDQMQFNAITAAMSMGLAAPQPQLVALYTNRDGNGTADILIVLAYRKQGTQLFVYDPHAPGDNNLSITVDAQGMHPFLAGNGKTYVAMAGMSITSLLPISTISSSYPAVLTGTIGAAEFGSYPLQLTSKYGRLGDTIWLSDTLRVWAQCAACTPVITSPSAPEATASLAAIEQWIFTTTGGHTTGRQLNVCCGRVIGYDFQASAVGQEADGLAIYRASAVNSPLFSWIDWVPLLLIKLGVTITPTPLTSYVGVPDSLGVKIDGTPPAHIAYQWDFGDGTPKVTVNDTPSVHHTWTAVGVYPIKLTLLDPDTRQPMATATASDSVIPPRYVWHFTSAGAATTQLPPGGIGTSHSDTLALGMINEFLGVLQNTPQNSSLFLETINGCSGLSLEQFPDGAVVDTGVVASAFRAALGVSCTVNYIAGTLTLGPLGSGSLVGTAGRAPGTPDDVLTIGGGAINATMNGATLQGTIVWNVNYSTGIATYTFPFTAMQVVPAP